MGDCRITKSHLPDSLCEKMEGPEPPDTFLSDGCTSAPDFIGGVDLRPACYWHDWSYRVGGDRQDRLDADLRFYRNLRACDLGRFKSGLYYRRVRLFGLPLFSWTPGERPHGLKVWLSNFLGRYLVW